jgi:hypothetical protein
LRQRERAEALDLGTDLGTACLLLFVAAEKGHYRHSCPLGIIYGACA